MAQVLAPHGLRGEVKCRIVTDFPKQRFRRSSSLLVRGQTHTIESARVQGTTVLLKLSGISDRNAAETLRGADIEVPTEAAVQLPRGRFYWHQVIGLEVEDATTHERLGRVHDIIETGANDVYVVGNTSNGKELLIPAIKDVVKEIDPTSGKMMIQLLPGMIAP